MSLFYGFSGFICLLEDGGDESKNGPDELCRFIFIHTHTHGILSPVSNGMHLRFPHHRRIFLIFSPFFLLATRLKPTT